MWLRYRALLAPAPFERAIAVALLLPCPRQRALKPTPELQDRCPHHRRARPLLNELCTALMRASNCRRRSVSLSWLYVAVVGLLHGRRCQLGSVASFWTVGPHHMLQVFFTCLLSPSSRSRMDVARLCCLYPAICYCETR